MIGKAGEDLRSLMLSTVSTVVAIADKHNVDRDEAIEYFATVFKMMQELVTFEEFRQDRVTNDHH